MHCVVVSLKFCCLCCDVTGDRFKLNMSRFKDLLDVCPLPETKPERIAAYIELAENNMNLLIE